MIIWEGWTLAVVIWMGIIERLFIPLGIGSDYYKYSFFYHPNPCDRDPHFRTAILWNNLLHITNYLYRTEQRSYIKLKQNINKRLQLKNIYNNIKHASS